MLASNRIGFMYGTFFMIEISHLSIYSINVFDLKCCNSIRLLSSCEKNHAINIKLSYLQFNK